MNISNFNFSLPEENIAQTPKKKGSNSNFFLPKPSLLIMILAFYNKDRILESYDFAKKIIIGFSVCND
tara:strand:+ start:19 stop:222 length:204 start_codon:yes stop_codon:yes gene_type:complete